MTLEQLRIFVAVAERQHVTQAARALNLAQSAASAAIAALEDRYQTALFHRVGRGITLTEAGRLFLVEAKAVLARAESADNKAALKAAVEEAKALGLPGAPCIVIENREVFWGNDRLEQALDWALRG